MNGQLLFISLILIVCIVLSKLTGKVGIPTLLVFIALGMFFGSDGVVKIPFSNYELAQQICTLLLMFIMFYGGFGTNWKMAKPVFGKAIGLSTIGVGLTAAITTGFCYFIMGMALPDSFLMAAVISSTDAASVFSILKSKKLNLKYRSASMLEVESGSNDPASYMLTIMALNIMQGKSQSIVLFLVKQIGIGVVSGVLIGVAAAMILKQIRFGIEGLETVFIVAVCILSFNLPELFGGNGYLAVYITGFIIGNSKFENKISLVHFFDGVTELAQMLIFFLLGLLSFPSQIPEIILPSILIFLFMTFVARPVAVFTILKPLRAPTNQCLFVSWAGLRGAASIVFAIIAVVSDAETNFDVFHIVFCISLMSVALQGTLLPWVAKKFSMIDENESVMKTFNDYQHEVQIQLIQTSIGPGHRWIGRRVRELDLKDMLIVLIKRGDNTIIPQGDTLVELYDILVLTGQVYRDDSNIRLGEIQIDEDSPWVGKLLKEIKLPKETLIMVIQRADGSFVVPNGDTVIEAGDIFIQNNAERMKNRQKAVGDKMGSEHSEK